MTCSSGLSITHLIYSCSILSEEFLRASLHDAGNLDVVIVSRAKERASVPNNGILDDVSMMLF